MSTRYNAEYPTVYVHDDLGSVIELDNNAGAALVGPDYLFEYEKAPETPAFGMTFSSCTARVGRLARVGVERVYETLRLVRVHPHY